MSTIIFNYIKKNAKCPNSSLRTGRPQDFPCLNRTKVGLKPHRPAEALRHRQGLNRTKVGLKRQKRPCRHRSNSRFESNQGGIETHSGCARLSHPGAGLNRTKVGLKPEFRHSLSPRLCRFESNQGGIETLVS